jgi:hypothetical protein
VLLTVGFTNIFEFIDPLSIDIFFSFYINIPDIGISSYLISNNSSPIASENVPSDHSINFEFDSI